MDNKYAHTQSANLFCIPPCEGKMITKVQNADQYHAVMEKLLDEANRPLCGMKTVDDPRHGKIDVTPHVYDLVMKDKLESCPQRTPGWYKKRNEHVTASLMATVCNANPYSKRSSALKLKTGRGEAVKGNAATEHGNKYEMEAILKYEKMANAKCLEFGLLESLNEGEEFLAASPDGITASGRLIEVKCPLRRVPTKKVPEIYVYQIQFLMNTLRLRDCDFIQYVPGGVWTAETLIVTRVKYDPYFWYAKFPVLRSFWDEVLRLRELHSLGVEVDDEVYERGLLAAGGEDSEPEDGKIRIKIELTVEEEQRVAARSRKRKTVRKKKTTKCTVIETCSIEPGSRADLLKAEAEERAMKKLRREKTTPPWLDVYSSSDEDGDGDGGKPRCTIEM